MYGTNIGKLEVYLKTISDDNGTLIWKQETSLPPAWLPAQIDIITDEEFQVSILIKYIACLIFIFVNHFYNRDRTAHFL